jgi:hypothetical protein
MRKSLARTAQLFRLTAAAALALAACSSEMPGVHEGNATGAYGAALELGAAQNTAPDALATQPSVQCGRQVNSGLGFYVDRGYFGTNSAGLVFGPLALLMPSGAVAPPTTATTFFMTVRLDPSAAPWMQPVITNTQLEYLAPPAFECAF